MIRRVVVIGLDGLEPKIAEPLLASGALPNLARMRGQGGFVRVATTSPARTPVAWSTFATGVNPGGHGIFDFLRRDPQTYLPDLALNRYEQKNAFLPPKVVNLRRGVPLWERLASLGVPATVLRCPCTYPPDPVKGRLLSGMGVPDLRGGLGTATFYTTAVGVSPGEAEMVVPLRRESDGSIATALIGPRSPKDRSDCRMEISLHPDSGRGIVRLLSAGAPSELTLRVGRWSDWLRVKFKLGMLQTIRGMVRFYLRRIEPELELYASPMNFDPEAPLFPISAPGGFAAELAGEIGEFYTAGMVEDHAALSNGRIDEWAFLDQCGQLWDEREAMMIHELERFDSGLFFCLFDTPDRAQHMLWRHREPDHPANRERSADPALARALEDQYRRADAAVGAALQFADDETLVIALSDHGFGSFRRGVNLNTWLYENGLLALRPGLQPGEDAGDLLRGIDWSRTKAYALGLGGVYLNLAGREAKGIVREDEADALAAEIGRELMALEDEGRGGPIRSLATRRQLYSGPYAAESPDLMVNFAEGYRASWGTSMGGVPEGLIEDNVKAWGGDHIIDPALVPGVLFMDRPFRGDGARLVDLAPTILEALNLPPVAALEGSSLLS